MASVRGKLHHSSKQANRDQLNECVISVIAGSKPHAPHGDSFAYNESCHDSYSQFPRSLLETPGSMAYYCAHTRLHFQSRSPLASSTKNN